MSYCSGGKLEVTELNKNSFYFHLLKQGGGKIDPRNIDFMIDTLKEWLPESTEDDDSWVYTPDYYNGQGDYKQFLMENLK